MDWHTLAKFAVPVVIVILASHGALSLMSRHVRKPGLRSLALTYSPGEGMWLLIWATIMAALWAWAFL